MSLRRDELPSSPNVLTESARLAATRTAIQVLASAIAEAEDGTEIQRLQAELQRLELAADSRRLELLIRDARAPQIGALVGDESLDSQQAADFLGRSLNWVYHHRSLLRGALVSPAETRSRYSSRTLERLMRSWSGARGEDT